MAGSGRRQAAGVRVCRQVVESAEAVCGSSGGRGRCVVEVEYVRQGSKPLEIEDRIENRPEAMA